MKHTETFVHKRAWENEIARCETEVMRLLPDHFPQREAKESVEAFAARCRALLDEALHRLEAAREQARKKP